MTAKYSLAREAAMEFLARLRRVLRRRRLANRQPVEIFSDYARRNKWGDKDSLSGKGSNLESTATLRTMLPALLRERGATSLLDVPCGDFFWMQHVDLTGISYLGGDIVPDLVNKNRMAHARLGIDFEEIDLITGPIPKADVVFVRDCLVHMSHEHVLAALANIVASGSTWLLTTTFTGAETNTDIATGEWRPINLTKAPFLLPMADQLYAEGQGHLKGQRNDKMLGLWKLDRLVGHVKPTKD
jgi:hypothetical protein